MKTPALDFKTTLAAIAGSWLVLASASLAQAASPTPHQHTEPAATHGMLVVGTEIVFLSHLPMFHPPHDYQAIFQAELDAETKAIYLKAKAQDPNETVYTLVPEKFVLPQMAANPVPFKAVLYKGHFERGGSPITSTITVQIKKVLSFEKLHAKGSTSAHSSYLVFGNPTGELFIAHKIGTQPDFDHLAQVEPQGSLGPLTGELAANGVAELLSAGPLLTAPLPDGPIQLQLGEWPSGLNTAIELVQKTQYLEFGDLAM